MHLNSLFRLQDLTIDHVGNTYRLLLLLSDHFLGRPLQRCPMVIQILPGHQHGRIDPVRLGQVARYCREAPDANRILQHNLETPIDKGLMSPPVTPTHGLQNHSIRIASVPEGSENRSLRLRSAILVSRKGMHCCLANANSRKQLALRSVPCGDRDSSPVIHSGQAGWSRACRPSTDTVLIRGSHGPTLLREAPERSVPLRTQGAQGTRNLLKEDPVPQRTRPRLE